MNIDYEKLTSDLMETFGSYHSLLDVPINGIVWENLLYNSLKDQSNNVIWNNGGHAAGADIEFDNIGISCKGGRLLHKGKDTFRISSYRSTIYKTLQEKLDYFDENHEDVYFCLSYEETDKHEYRLFTFDSDVLDYKSLKWQKTKSGWKGSGAFDATIQKSMSDQLWLFLPIKLLTERFFIGIEKDDKYYRTTNSCNAEKLSVATLDQHLTVGE